MDDHVNIRDLRGFPRPVAEVVAEAVNKHGAKIKLMDGTHLRLYNGDRGVVPIKVAGVREAKYTLDYLIPWLEQHIPSWTAEKVTREKLETLARAVTTEPKVRAKAVTTAEPEVKVEAKPETKPEAKTLPEIPADLICTWPGCGRQSKTSSGYRMHWAGHTGEKKKHAAKGAETARLNRDQNRIIAKQALAALAEMHALKVIEVDQVEDDVKALKKVNDNLKKQVERLTKERDDALARVSLLNEAFRGLE